jgi:hypothetical protein
MCGSPYGVRVPALIPKLWTDFFELFIQPRATAWGIGLSVSRSIIERHHGRLWAEPNEGPGATFSFSIPRRADESVRESQPDLLRGFGFTARSFSSALRRTSELAVSWTSNSAEIQNHVLMTQPRGRKSLLDPRRRRYYQVEKGRELAAAAHPIADWFQDSVRQTVEYVRLVRRRTPWPPQFLTSCPASLKDGAVARRQPSRKEVRKEDTRSPV